MNKSKLWVYAGLVAVVIIAVVLARPFGAKDFKDPQPLDSYTLALGANKPVFIMFTMDT